MKIKVEVPMSDFFAVKNLIPSVIAGKYDEFLAMGEAFCKKQEKKGIRVTTSFSIISGFEFTFDAKAAVMITAIEDELKMDLKILIEGISSASMMMMAVGKASEEAWKGRKENEKDEDEN